MNPTTQPSSVPDNVSSPSTATSPITLAPNYQEIIGQIIGELNKRKGILLKRVLFYLAPVLLAFVLVTIASWLGDGGDVPTTSSTLQMTLLIPAFILFIFVAPTWIFVVGIIFRTERTIWIDAFFDHVVLTTKQSWKIAKSLFWPSFKLNIAIFFRFYALALLVALAVIATGIYLGVQADEQTATIVILLAVLGSVVGIAIYCFITEIRLRYISFIFLDAYGSPDFSHAKIFASMKELNARLKKGDLQKIVLTTVGVDAAAAASSMAVNGVANGLSLLGGGGRAAGQMVAVVGGTMIEIAKDYSKQVSYYIFYRLARQSVYGADDKGSVSLYKDVTGRTF